MYLSKYIGYICKNYGIYLEKLWDLLDKNYELCWAKTIGYIMGYFLKLWELNDHLHYISLSLKGWNSQRLRSSSERKRSGYAGNDKKDMVKRMEQFEDFRNEISSVEAYLKAKNLS